MVALAILHNVASTFVDVLQRTPALADIEGFDRIELVLIGGVADVDFAIYPPTLGPPVKCALLEAHPGLFHTIGDQFLLRTGQNSVQIDMVPVDALSFRPSSLSPLSAMNPQLIPHLSATDLIISKAICCGGRGSWRKNAQDANDVWEVIGRSPVIAPGVLSPNQCAMLRAQCVDLIRYAPKHAWADVLP
ncbi:uncharacterized protein LDX57_010573 [Aspergillus melleus]|uniref:uncharacterized protein n=1 Tax=Aspergillus melleus TaxID=138277 RepID=UPI001E8CBBCE|nr:uncharacterized protein LDX57_010573 [Aspergillus melleus]KAH8432940.1 hypothetical protein LDX57_010573 [Aspergillus melleus]